MLDTVQPHPQPQAGVPSDHLAQEFAETLRLAVPMMLTQLGQIAMITTDLALIGRLGESAVAAAALAHTVYFVSFTFGLGLMAAVSPLVAQAFGAGDVRRIRRSLRVGLWASVFVGVPITVEIPNNHSIGSVGRRRDRACGLKSPISVA